MTRFSKAQSGMTITEHLRELRQRLMVVFIALFITSTIAFIFYPQILHVLQEPYCHSRSHGCEFLVTNPLDGITLRIKVALFGGFLLSFPVTLWELWRFITPGLKARERKYALPFVFASLILFSCGGAVAYFTFGRALSWLESIGGHSLVTEYNPNQYLTLFLLMILVFGATFEFPLLLVALQLANIVKPAQLLKSWRYAVIGITIVAAVITPSSDPFSMMALALPLTAFYFLAIGIGKLCRK
jgi:sec-independent protein translocase protein TatC